jgi:hypothetical protein
MAPALGLCRGLRSAIFVVVLVYGSEPNATGLRYDIAYQRSKDGGPCAIEVSSAMSGEEGEDWYPPAPVEATAMRKAVMRSLKQLEARRSGPFNIVKVTHYQIVISAV